MILIPNNNNLESQCSSIGSTESLLPPLPPNEYQALLESVRQYGVRVPGLVDQHGVFVDGWHRDRACQELGRYCPREVRHFESEAAKLETALTLNCRRRHLTCTQHRELIACYLKKDPGINDNHLGEIVGVSKNTVADVRSQLESTCQIDKLVVRRGRDGKNRPAKYGRIIANTPNQTQKALEAIMNLPSSDQIMDAITAQRRAKRHRKSVVREEALSQPICNQDIQLFHCPFQKLEKTAGVKPNTVDSVLTDIPYIGGFLPEIHELAAFAERVLIPGGVFATYSGQYYLDQMMTAFGQKLIYRWMIASVWDGDGSQIHPLNISSQWKPILIFSKGDWKAHGRMPDVSRVTAKEKGSHEWQQPLDEVRNLVSYLSNPGDLVVDPCAGSFTTALACRGLRRRFIGCDVHANCVAEGQRRLAEAAAGGILNSAKPFCRVENER